MESVDRLAIQLEIYQLEMRLAILKKKLSDMPPEEYQPPFVPINSTCPKCGISISGAMGYCCPHKNCPTGLGGSWCSDILSTGCSNAK